MNKGVFTFKVNNWYTTFWTLFIMVLAVHHLGWWALFYMILLNLRVEFRK
jgi:hypothetical protein